MIRLPSVTRILLPQPLASLLLVSVHATYFNGLAAFYCVQDLVSIEDSGRLLVASLKLDHLTPPEEFVPSFFSYATHVSLETEAAAEALAFEADAAAESPVLAGSI